MSNQQEQYNIDFLVQQLRTSQDNAVLKQTAKHLGFLGANNPDVIAALINIVRTTIDEPTRWTVIQSLGEIGTDNNDVIQTLIEQLNTARIPSRRIAAQNLAKIAVGNQYAITNLISLAQITEEEYTRQYVVYSLRLIGKGNREAINTLIDLIYKTSDEYTHNLCVDGFTNLGKWNKEIIDALIHIDKTAEFYNRLKLLRTLEVRGINLNGYTSYSSFRPLLEQMKEQINQPE
ncbi:MAG: HEAT repeat domain-containing protein [Nostoc sp. CreGUA01]|nr:HEAT repeat domain-containing protein [Nostoc sp. CreGUA01]